MKQNTKYLDRDGVKLAYQIHGQADRDLILVPGIVSHVEYAHRLPGYTDFILRLAKTFRVVIFDKRGNGLSGRIKSPPTLEERMDDIRLVMDEIHSQRAVIFGFSEGGSLSALYSAMHPERVDRLIIFGSFAVLPEIAKLSSLPTLLSRLLFNFGIKRETRRIRDSWGNGDFIRKALPSKLMVDGKLRETLKEFEKQSTTSEGMAAMVELTAKIDIRPFLKDVHCPTLVMHSRDDNLVPFESGSHIQESIENSEFVELKEAGHSFYMSESDYILDKILEFTGARLEPSKQESDGRILATILFNDIVDSTNLQSHHGDTVWREKIEKFNAISRNTIETFDGQYIKSMGDGILAIFSGPTRAIKCAMKLKEEIKSLGFEVRTGLHVGEIELIGDDISGINVNAAARIQSLAQGSEVLVSEVLKSLVFGSGITFKDAGAHTLKGFEDKWSLKQVTAIGN